MARKLLSPEVHASRLIRQYGPTLAVAWIAGAALLAGLMAAAALWSFWEGEGGWLILPGAALAYVSVVLVRKFARTVRQRLEFRESGIVYFDGVDRVELPWGDVNTIHVRLSDPLDKVLFGRKNYDVTINRGQSNEVSFGPELKESEELTRTLREITAKKICDRLYSDLVRGQHVSVGPIEVLPSGLMYRTQLLLWAEVAGAQLKDEKLIISERGTSRSREWARIDVESVPNADAFVRLVERRGSHA